MGARRAQMVQRAADPVEEVGAADDGVLHGSQGPCGRRRWLVLATLVASAGLFRVTQNMAITSFSLLGQRDLALGATTLGVLGALSGLVLVVVMVTVAARVPPRHAAAAVAAASLLLVGALVAFAAATSLAVFALAIVLLGAAGGLGLPVLLNAVEEAAGENRQRAAALYSVALSASLAVGPVLETAVLDGTSQALRAPFVVFIPLALLAAALVLAQVRRAHRFAGKGAARKGAAGPPRPPGDTPATGRRTWRTGLLGARGGRLALTAQLLYAVPFAGITVFAALVGHFVFGASPAETQLGFTAFFMTSLAVRVLVSWRSPVVHKMAFFLLSALLTAGGIMALGTGHGLVVFFVAMGILGVPHGLTFPLSLALVADSMSGAELPRANANLLAASNVATIVVPPVLGGLVPFFGYRGMTLFILVPLGLFTALLWFQRQLRPVPGRQPLR